MSFGDAFVDAADLTVCLDFVSGRCESSTEHLSKERQKLQDLLAQMKQLRVELYAKFGQTINLEFE